MTDRYYELHITMVGEAEAIQPVVEGLGWSFSKIDGDPVEGLGIKCYATTHRHANHGEQQTLELLNRAGNDLEESGFEVTRRKIELVIHDTKSSKVRIPEPEMPQGRTAAEIGAWIAERDSRFAVALEEAKGLASAASEDDFSRSVALVCELCPAMSVDKQADFIARAFWPVIERAPFTFDFIEKLTQQLVSARDGPSSWRYMNEDSRRYWIHRTTDAVQRARQPQGEYLG